MCVNGLIPPHPPYDPTSKEEGLQQVFQVEFLTDRFVLSDVLLAAFQEALDFPQDLLVPLGQLAVGEQVLRDVREGSIPHHLRAELRLHVGHPTVWLKGLTQRCGYVLSSTGCTKGPTLVIKQAKPSVLQRWKSRTLNADGGCKVHLSAPTSSKLLENLHFQPPPLLPSMVLERNIHFIKILLAFGCGGRTMQLFSTEAIPTGDHQSVALSQWV